MVDITTSSIRLPKLAAELTPADVVAELDVIPERCPDLVSVEITPPKVAVLDVISEEAWKDARPAVLAAHERELVRSVAAGLTTSRGTRRAAIPGGPASRHVRRGRGRRGRHARGLGRVRRGTRRPRRRGSGAVRDLPRAHDVGPAVPAQEGHGSNEPLISAELSATGRPERAILGVPVFLSGTMPADKAVVAQASEIVVVRRSDFQVDVDEHFKFSQAGVGVRVIFRAQTFLAAPAGVAVIANLPTT